MSIKGKWRIVEMPDFEADYLDMVEPAYILFENGGSGEFAIGCVTGQIWGAGVTATATEFSWNGNDEMDEVCGHGSAELHPDSSLQGEIRRHNGDDYSFTAHRWTSSTAC
jgi:hypothetical protein